MGKKIRTFLTQRSSTSTTQSIHKAVSRNCSEMTLATIRTKREPPAIRATFNSRIEFHIRSSSPGLV